MVQGCEQALRSKQKKQEREQTLLARERDELLRQVQREESEEAQKEAIKRDRMKKRSEEISRHVMESIELKRKRKIADAAEERKMMARYARELEQREEERQPLNHSGASALDQRGGRSWILGGFGAERDVTRWVTPFKSYNKNGLDLSIEFAHGESLIGKDLDDLVTLAAEFSQAEIGRAHV